MANQITVTDIDPARSLVAASSRYKTSKVIYYGANNKLTFETYKRTPQTPSSSDRFAVIPAGQEYRPDLTSQQVYGTPSFWWRIMEANNIFDVFDYKAGTNIRLPVNPL